MSQLHKDSAGSMIRHDGTPPHYHLDLPEYMNRKLPQLFMGSGTEEDDI
jgi:hypothetical protein